MSEFTRAERIDAIGEGERHVTIVADEAERRALAARFGLVGIDALNGDFAIRREAAGIHVTGRVTASLTQACSITDDPLPVSVDEAVALLFVFPGGADSDEIELSEDSLDTVEIEGASIDLGEVAAETMALGLDPYPRGPNAAAALKAAGVLSEEEAKPASPFAALKDKFQS